MVFGLLRKTVRQKRKWNYQFCAFGPTLRQSWLAKKPKSKTQTNLVHETKATIKLKSENEITLQSQKYVVTSLHPKNTNTNTNEIKIIKLAIWCHLSTTHSHSSLLFCWYGSNRLPTAESACRNFDFLNVKKLDIKLVIDIQQRKAVFFFYLN